MTLTEADVARLEEAGHADFVRLNEAGDLEMVNRDGACVFLRRGRCGVYHQRPEGCRFYPFVVDLGSGRVVRDDFCPYADEFSSNEEVVRELKRSVEREGAEARRRRRHHG
jgi:Fe-S-cluster containining protein